MTANKLGAELAEKQAALIRELEAKKTADGYDLTPEEVDSFRARQKELDYLGEQWEKARDLDEMSAKAAERLRDLQAADSPLVFTATKGGDTREQYQSLGKQFVSKFYDRDRSGRVIADGKPSTWSTYGRGIELAGFDVGAEFKTTMTTSAGFAPENLRSGRLQPFAVRNLNLFDVFPTLQVGVNNNAYVYMEETSFTNNAAEIAENSAGAPEGTLGWTERSVAIRNIATFLPVTDEQLADVLGMESYINTRLTYMVRQRLETQLIAGDNVAPNINGLVTAISQSQAKGSDPIFDCVMKGMTRVRFTGFAEPDAVLLHPNDWQEVRLTRTTDGVYLLGNPADSGPERLFGVPVVVSPALTENTGYVGDFGGHSAIAYRRGIEVKVTDSHSDYFIKFLQAVRASIRAGLVIFRATAFCKLTGI